MARFPAFFLVSHFQGDSVQAIANRLIALLNDTELSVCCAGSIVIYPKGKVKRFTVGYRRVYLCHTVDIFSAGIDLVLIVEDVVNARHDIPGAAVGINVDSFFLVVPDNVFKNTVNLNGVCTCVGFNKLRAVDTAVACTYPSSPNVSANGIFRLKGENLSVNVSFLGVFVQI